MGNRGIVEDLKRHIAMGLVCKHIQEKANNGIANQLLDACYCKICHGRWIWINWEEKWEKIELKK